MNGYWSIFFKVFFSLITFLIAFWAIMSIISQTEGSTGTDYAKMWDVYNKLGINPMYLTNYEREVLSNAELRRPRPTQEADKSDSGKRSMPGKVTRNTSIGTFFEQNQKIQDLAIKSLISNIFMI